MEKAALVLVLSAGVLACAPLTINYRSTGSATWGDFVEAREECDEQTRETLADAAALPRRAEGLTRDAPGCRAFRSCLAGKGFVDDRRGSFKTPPESMIDCWQVGSVKASV